MLTATQLLAAAKTRFGEPNLRNRIAPGQDNTTKDAELLKIASSVVSDVHAAAQSSVGWPLKGSWSEAFISPIDGTPQAAGVEYKDIWPYGLFQKALDIVDYRSYSAMEVLPAEKVKSGQAAEAWLRAVARGDQGLGIGIESDTTPPEPLSARDRQGNNLLNDGGIANDRVLDLFTGSGWDWVN
jgi:hypothetical protein